MSVQPPKSFDTFDFGLARAVLEQLIDQFDALPIGRLDSATINKVFAEQGVYQLFLANRLVYVRKTSKALPDSLLRHLHLLSERKDIHLADVGFKCVSISRNWMDYVDQTSLVAYYKGLGLCGWNDDNP